MIGGIRVRAGERWSTSLGVFSWIIDQLAEEVSDEELAAELREISEHDLGTLDLGRVYPSHRREELCSVIARLPQIAEVELPDTDGKSGVLLPLHELVDRVRTGADQRPAAPGRVQQPVSVDRVVRLQRLEQPARAVGRRRTRRDWFQRPAPPPAR